MSGFGDEVNSVLQSPLTQTLAPAILGGVGGALSAPPMLGRRGAIGYGLQGGAQGLERGMELAGQQKELAVRQQEAQERFALAQEQLKHIQLTDELAQRAIQGQDRSLPTLRNILKQASQSPAGKVVFGGLSDDAINNLDYDTATKLLDTYQKSSAAVLRNGKLPNGQKTVEGDRTYWIVGNPEDPTHPFKTDIGPAPEKEFAPKGFEHVVIDTPEGPHVGKFSQATGNIEDTGVRAPATASERDKQIDVDENNHPVMQRPDGTHYTMTDVVVRKTGSAANTTDEDKFNKSAAAALKTAGVVTTGPNAMHPVSVDDATDIVTYSTDPNFLGNSTTKTVHVEGASKQLPNVEHISKQGNKKASSDEDDLVNEHSGK